MYVCMSPSSRLTWYTPLVSHRTVTVAAATTYAVPWAGLMWRS
jgi:hypothetical protein